MIGTDYADTYEATSAVSNQFGTFNEFEGGDGDDQITGNGFTRVGYRYASEAVTVDLALGTGKTTSGENANVGLDQFTGVNSVAGSAYGDTLLGSDVVTLETFRGHAGHDTIDGRGGLDRADYRNSTNGIVATMGGNGTGSGTVQDGFGSTDTLIGIEQIRGSEFADQITGDTGDNFLEGMAGNDLLVGGGGNDTLSGGSGFNTLIGGAGNDTLIGRSLAEGPNNTFGNNASYADATAAITATMSGFSQVTGDASVGTDTLHSIDRVIGSSFDDTFTADGAVSNQFGNFIAFEGGGGNDLITGNGNTRVTYVSATAGVTVNSPLAPIRQRRTTQPTLASIRSSVASTACKDLRSMTS